MGFAVACSSSNRGSTNDTDAGNASIDRSLTDVTAAIVANQDVVLDGDAVIRLPEGATTYSGVISGNGTLRLSTVDGKCTPSTWIITRTSTFTLPEDRQTEIVTKAGPWPNMGYRLDVAGSNPPVLKIDPCVTFQIGTNTAADDHPNIIATSDSKNPAALINGEINLDNIENNGVIALSSSHFILLGQISGTGSINQLPNVWGGNSLASSSSFSGVLALSAGQDFGSNHVPAALTRVKAVINEGSWLIWSPANNTANVTQNIYEAAFGGDINFHPIGNSTIVMSGTYSHTDNSPHNSPNLDDPGLSDPSLNLAKVIYRSTMTVNGNDASYRGINIEAEGTVQWGDGTHSRFFLPTAPSPAEVSPALGAKNGYINLHRNGTLAFNYNGPVTLNVGITGGGGGPDKSGVPGAGNVTIMGTAGNDVTFAQPQDYNGTTTIGAGATLRLGTGSAVPLDYVTLTNGTKSVQHVGEYTGDSGLLTAESARGNTADKIINDGTLIVQNTQLPITISHMSGAGQLLQNGAAQVTILANSYRGGTVINGGLVIVADDQAFGSSDVENHSRLQTDGRQRIIRVVRDYRQTKQASLRLLVRERGQVEHLVVENRAKLAGKLELVARRGAVGVGQRWVAVSAKDGIEAQLDSVELEGYSVVGHVDGPTYSVVVTGKKRRAKPPEINDEVRRRRSSTPVPRSAYVQCAKWVE